VEKLDSTYTRPPAVAGAFYPGSPAELAKMMAGFFYASPKPRIATRPLAIISPHAGYAYSGQIAARGYKILEGEEYSTVIVISPSHTVYFSGVAAFGGKAYSTPLGDISINRVMTNRLVEECGLVRLSGEGHYEGGGRSEHALEVQLPFLQATLGKFALVALVMGDQDIHTSTELGRALAKVIAKNDSVLIVASSDLSHFHDSGAAAKLDSVAMINIQKLDYRSLAEDLAAHKTEACGGGPIIAAMVAAREQGAAAVEITGLGNSGETTGDKARVVGYLSAVIYREKDDKVYEIDEDAELSKSEATTSQISNIDSTKQAHSSPSTNSGFGLTESDKKLLLSIARESIETYLGGREYVIPRLGSEILDQPLGAFVTLHERGDLRGCIGTFRPGGPLRQVVARMAREAAFSDYRFQPVTNRELESIDIEISVLTPMRKIDDPNNVAIGHDGLYVRRGINSGVLLPQVPVEQGWDREEFLDHACLKAGLPTRTWHDTETELYVFQAEIFGERSR